MAYWYSTYSIKVPIKKHKIPTSFPKMETYFAKIPYNSNNIKTQNTPFHIQDFN
jgi:hypothetical protein